MERWLETKAELTKDFPSLLSKIERRDGGKPYADNGDRIVDQIIFDELSKHTGVPPYDPYLVENLINATVKLLDRCLGYRTALYDIEGIACKQALDYKLFKDQLPFLKTIELAKHIKDQNDVLKTGNEDAAKSFAKDKAPLNQGFSQVATATANSSDKGAKGEGDRQTAVENKWTKAEEYQAALQARHSAKGHALNFAERFENIRVLLVQDVGIAYDKMRCIEEGANEIFRDAPVTIPKLPSPSADDYLGKMLYWIRSLIDELEKGLSAEFEFVHVVHLHTPRINHKRKTKQLIKDPVWNAAMVPAGSGLLTFDLKIANEFPSGFFSHLRLSGIGVAYSKDFIEGGQLSYNRLSAVVFPPPGAKFFSGSSAPRSPVILESVSTIDKDFASKLTSADSIQNIDPRGPWSILVSPNIGFCDSTARLIQAGPLVQQVTDIKLLLKIRAIASSAPRDWAGFDY